MEISEYLQSYIESKDFKDWLSANDFNRIYGKAVWDYVDQLERPSIVGQLTELFYSFDIDPLQYLSGIPESFARGSSIAIKNFNIPDGITHISKYSFLGCKGIKEITMPDSVTTIGAGVFATSEDIERVKLSNSITKIPVNSFYGCRHLQVVEIGAGIKSIERFAFGGCFNLKLIIYEGTVKEWNALDKYILGKPPTTNVVRIKCKNGTIKLKD